jgi:hypothetical protein
LTKAANEFAFFYVITNKYIGERYEITKTLFWSCHTANDPI